MAKSITSPKKGRLSKKDFDIFKENIHLSDEDLAKLLNRTVSFMEKTRKRVYPNKKTGKWNNSDLEVLNSNIDSMSIDELSRLLNRTERAINTKVKSLSKVIPNIAESVIHTKPMVEDTIENITNVEPDIEPEVINQTKPLEVDINWTPGGNNDKEINDDLVDDNSLVTDESESTCGSGDYISEPNWLVRLWRFFFPVK